MVQQQLEDNQARCNFFKKFQYSTKDKLGQVSVQRGPRSERLCAGPF